MITFKPRDSADFANSKSKSGVRCAETIFVSCSTAKSLRTSDANFIVDQSDLLPMIMATRGCFLFVLIIVDANHYANHMSLVCKTAFAVHKTNMTVSKVIV